MSEEADEWMGKRIPDRVVPIARRGNVVIFKRVTGSGEEIRERAVIIGKDRDSYLLRKEDGTAMFIPVSSETAEWFDTGMSYVLRDDTIRAKNGSISADVTKGGSATDTDVYVLDWCRLHDVSNARVRYVEEGGRVFITSIDGRPTRIEIDED